MTERPEMDPMGELRQADPVRTDQLPLASLARIRARIQEETTLGTGTTGATRPGWRAPRVLGLAAGAAAVAVFALVMLNRGGGAAPGVLPDPPAGGVSARCAANYDLETLRDRDFAFDGTVASIIGDSVTFTVNESFRGQGSGSVTLDANGMTGTSITSAGGPSLSEGERYLVAGDDRFVWACGFTQPYQSDVATQWADAFAG